MAVAGGVTLVAACVAKSDFEQAELLSRGVVEMEAAWRDSAVRAAVKGASRWTVPLPPEQAGTGCTIYRSW